ncbi:thiamine pyrophosphate-dependent enzyme [Streptomyces nogalater]
MVPPLPPPQAGSADASSPRPPGRGPQADDAPPVPTARLPSAAHSVLPLVRGGQCHTAGPHRCRRRRHLAAGHRRSPFPRGARFVAQPMWASIGFSLPALLGAQLADPSRRGVLLIGDGAAQLTAQELGTISRYHLKPIVILVNNHGYTIERITHGLRAPYNDVARWHWTKVPTALGVSHPLVLRARTRTALDRALARATATTDRLVLIEAFTSQYDVPRR